MNPDVEIQNNKALARVLAAKMGISTTMHFDHPDDVCDYVRDQLHELKVFRRLEVDLPYTVRMLKLGDHRTGNIESALEELKAIRISR